MAGRWSLHLFDWTRYAQLAPRLAEAAASDDFGQLDDAEADDLLEELDESAAPQEVCNALLLHLCVSAESAVFDKGLPELVLWMRRRPDTEEAAEAIGALLSKGTHVEEWFACDLGLMGLLTHREVVNLDHDLDAFRRSYQPPRKPRGIGSLARLLTPTDPAKESVDHLLAIIRHASDTSMGLAAVLEV